VFGPQADHVEVGLHDIAEGAIGGERVPDVGERLLGLRPQVALPDDVAAFVPADLARDRHCPAPGHGDHVSPAVLGAEGRRIEELARHRHPPPRGRRPGNADPVAFGRKVPHPEPAVAAQQSRCRTGLLSAGNNRDALVRAGACREYQNHADLPARLNVGMGDARLHPNAIWESHVSYRSIRALTMANVVAVSCHSSVTKRVEITSKRCKICTVL
jgi:hypothetical protein